MSRRARRGERGLSLIEMVVVIAIGGLLLALAFGGSSLIADRRLVGATRKLLSDVRMLEQRARTERTCYRIVFDPAGNSYTMARYDPAQVTPAPSGGGSQCTNSGAWGTTPEFLEAAGDSVSRRMPRDVDLVSTTFGADTLEFSPLGNPTAGTVTLRTTAGATRQVIVEPMGRARIAP